MPALGRMEPELRGKGIQVISVDLDETAEAAAHFMAIHNFAWPNFHDGDGLLGTALSEHRIPLTLLVDKDGRVVYAGVEGNEAALRAAVASLKTQSVAGIR